jgi:hypothetical protein
MIPLWKGKNPIYFGAITIIPFDNLYRWAYFVMQSFLVIVYGLFLNTVNVYVQYVVDTNTDFNILAIKSAVDLSMLR